MRRTAKSEVECGFSAAPHPLTQVGQVWASTPAENAPSRAHSRLQPYRRCFASDARDYPYGDSPCAAAPTRDVCKSGTPSYGAHTPARREENTRAAGGQGEEGEEGSGFSPPSRPDAPGTGARNVRRGPLPQNARNVAFCPGPGWASGGQNPAQGPPRPAPSLPGGRDAQPTLNTTPNSSPAPLVGEGARG